MASSNFSRHDFFVCIFLFFVCFRLHSPLVMTAEKKGNDDRFTLFFCDVHIHHTTDSSPRSLAVPTGRGNFLSLKKRTKIQLCNRLEDNK
jgi:hypothetical protein